MSTSALKFSLKSECFCVYIFSTASENGRFKTICCIPVFLIVIFIIACAMTGVILLCLYGFHITEPEHTAESSVVVGIAIIIGLALLGNCYTWGRIIVNIVISPRRRIQKIANKITSLSGMEPVMQVSTAVFAVWS